MKRIKNEDFQEVDHNQRFVYKKGNCTYFIEYGDELGYEQTKRDLGRVLAKIKLGM